MSARIFVIGDTHFGHKKIAEVRGFASVEEHDLALIHRWNSVVTKHDTVWHLGDVCFSKSAFDCLGRLNGIKKLIMGNHDQYRTEWYSTYFARLAGAEEIHGAMLTHIPIHESQFDRYQLNIHGHLHHKTLPDRRYRCASAEQNNLTPIELASLLD